MGLFEKKYCDICGEKIKFLGTKKLEDGIMCKDCTKKLSPWMSDRRHTLLGDIRAHLAYREENLLRYDAFQCTRSFGKDTKIFLNDNDGTFIVSRRPSREENPDVISLNQVLSCEPEITEHETEELHPGPDGKNVPYIPPRYNYQYTFNIKIQINSPWFSEIKFQLAYFTTKQPGGMEYYTAECAAVEIHNALMPEYPYAMPEKPVVNVFRPYAPRPVPFRPIGGTRPPARPPVQNRPRPVPPPPPKPHPSQNPRPGFVRNKPDGGGSGREPGGR